MEKVYFLKKHDKQFEIKLKNNEFKQFLIIDILNCDVDLNINVNLLDNCEFDLVLSCLNKTKFKKTYNIKVFHDGNNSKSKCEVFGINKDESKTNFYLEAIIKKESFDNYCEQKIRGVLLSNKTEIQGKPNLIIDTNNIKAKHALAIGKLNIDHLFYLQSKGINKNFAIKLLLLSYFNVILYRLDKEEQRQELINKIFLEIGEVD